MKTNVTPMKRLYAATAVLFMMFATVNTHAQTAFGEDVNDQASTPTDPEVPEQPEVPADGYIYAGILAAGIIGYTATRRKTAAV